MKTVWFDKVLGGVHQVDIGGVHQVGSIVFRKIASSEVEGFGRISVKIK